MEETFVVIVVIDGLICWLVEVVERVVCGLVIWSWCSSGSGGGGGGGGCGGVAIVA